MRLTILTDITERTGSWIGRYEPLARELVKLGHRVTVLAPHPAYQTMRPQQQLRWCDGVVVRYVGPCFFRELRTRRRYVCTATMLGRAARTIARMVIEAHRTEYDVLIVAKPLPMASFAALVLRGLRGRPILVDCDDYELVTNNHQSRFQRLALQLVEAGMPRLANAVVTHSAFLERRLRARGVASRQLHYVPNGIDVARLGDHPAPHARQTGFIRVLYFGDLNVNSGHNVDLLLEAAALYAASANAAPFELRIIGDGKDSATLKVRAAQLGLDACVQWRGRIDPYEIRHELEQADIVADPVSLSPGNLGRCPLKILEAMHCAIPVLTSDVGERRRLLQDAGMFVPAGEAGCLADGLAALIGNRELRNHLGRRARSLAYPYRWSTLARRFETILDRIRRRPRTANTPQGMTS